MKKYCFPAKNNGPRRTVDDFCSLCEYTVTYIMEDS